MLEASRVKSGAEEMEGSGADDGCTGGHEEREEEERGGALSQYRLAGFDEAGSSPA